MSDELNTYFEDKIATAHRAILARNAAEKRLSDALHGSNHMIRWDKKSAPGEKSYDGFSVETEQVEHLIREAFEPELNRLRDEAEEAINVLIMSCQPGG